MCIDPRSIINKAYRDTSLHTPRYIDVPCGHCWQCKASRINSVTWRILQDVDYFKCPTCFVTLSYSDLYLPKLLYFDKNRHLQEISCWNRSHVTRFIKRIRRKLHYYFGVSSDSFKYFISCERGSDDVYISDSGKTRKGTSRVHYHSFFYLCVNKSLSPIRSLPTLFLKSDYALEQYSLLECFWHYLLSSEWFYGNVDLKYLYHDNVSAIRYVCKYICKDIDEPLFSIKPDDIYQFVDPEYDISSQLWFIQLKPCSKDDEGSFLYEGNYYVPGNNHKKFPTAVRYCSLLPRCMGSSSIGISFLYDKSVDELIDYLSGNKKVCLPSVNGKSSLINLPNYYYRILCKDIKFIPDGKNYLRSRVLPHNVVTSFLNHSSVSRVRVDWDNCVGLHLVFCKSTLSQSVTSDLGYIVKRLKYKNYVSNYLVSLRYFYSNRSLFYELLSKYSHLPSEFRSSTFDVFFESFFSEDILTHFAYSDITFKRVAKVLSYSFAQYSDIPSPDDKYLFCFIKLVSVCKYYLAHLVHLKNDKVYNSKFYSSCMDNPDLFISHSYD